MLPPTSVCNAAPMLPITLRERTVMPRTMPTWRTTRQPAISFAVVIISRANAAIAASVPTRACRLLHHVHELLDVERLGQVMIRAGAKRRFASLVRRGRRQRDDAAFVTARAKFVHGRATGKA